MNAHSQNQHQNKMKAKNLLFIFLAAFLVSALHAKDTHESWIDSAIAEGVYKIKRSEDIRSGNYIPTAWDKLNHLDKMQFVIEIDLAKWTPLLAESQFYYQRTNTPGFGSIGSGTFRIWDSLNTYHLSYENRSDYVPYYNIVLKNFPLELRKDISSVKTSEGQNLYTQLQGLGAIKTEDYQESLDKFRLIINNICITAQTNFNLGRIVCFGSANFLGQYGNKPEMRASFGSFYVAQFGFPAEYTWLNDLQRIPKYMCPPIPELEHPTLDEKNFKIALAVKHFIQCNVYNDCSMNSQDFSNPYAAWLFDNLKSAGNISKPLLLSTCVRLNQLSTSMAWSVLTADYENGFASYQYNPLGSLYSFYTDATLNTIGLYTKQILRAEKQILLNADINRDSALYYGRLLYRIPAVMSTISTTQRVNLLKKITVSSCSDMINVTEASDYENHCERICRSLYTNLPVGEEKNFLLQLKSTGVIWDLSYRLDNSTIGFFGNDNYTHFIFTISEYWQRAFPEKMNATAASNINFFVYKWDDDFFNDNGWIVVNRSANAIFSFTTYRDGFNGGPGTNHVSDIYDPVMVSAMSNALIPDQPGVKELVVPAIFLDWLSHKKTMSNIGTATETAIALASLAVGVGELYHATSATLRVIAAIEVAISVSDLVLMNESVKQSVINLFPSQAEGQAFVQAYTNITMAINVAVIGKGLITNLNADMATFTSKFDAQEQGLKGVMGEGSAEFVGMKKLRGELGEVVVGDINLNTFVSETGISAYRISNASLLNEVKAWQGHGDYPGVDDWFIVEIPSGTKVLGGLPGQSEFYSFENVLNASNFDKSIYWKSLQVKEHATYGYRTQLGEYTANKPIQVAISKATNNTQFGTGGGWQIYISNFSTDLNLSNSITLH
jgi:hypothetical protein